MLQRFPAPFTTVRSGLQPACRSLSLRTIVPYLTIVLALTACQSPVQSGSGGGGDDGPTARLDHCSLTTDDLTVGAEWDAIRAIDDPRFVAAEDLPADFISGDQRVIGLRIEGESIAIPQGEIWAHEIVNLDRSVNLAVTFCPLTGSALAFDREVVNGATMGVSGFLLHENLVMFDRTARPLIWAQMSASPLCEDPRVERLRQWPLIEVRWETWHSLHPNTLVLEAADGPDGGSGSSGARPVHPLAATSSEGPGSPGRRPEARFATAPEPPSPSSSRSERVIGAPSSATDPGIAFPFGALVERTGERQVLSFEYDGEGYRLLWSDGAMGGMAYSPRTDSGREVDLVPVEGLDPGEGGFRDQNTGSLFTLDGRGVAGSLTGAVLVPLAETYVAYRGPWLDFHPNSRMWGE